jgi:uncharacterized membrane protein
MNKGRLEAFTDGVVAIIITIMVLEIRVPQGTSLESLRAGVPVFLAYVLSYLNVGIFWNNHHHMLHASERVNGKVLWANLALLFCLSLFPFTTQWTEATRYARTAVVVYGVNLLLAAIAYYVLQTLIIRTQGVDSALRKAIGSDIKGKVSPFFYIAGALAALLGGGGHGAARPGIWIAVACYVAAALWWFIPDRRIETAVVTEDSVADPSPRTDSDQR